MSPSCFQKAGDVPAALLFVNTLLRSVSGKAVLKARANYEASCLLSEASDNDEMEGNDVDASLDVGSPTSQSESGKFLADILRVFTNY